MGEIVKDEETSELRYEKKIDDYMFWQDIRDLTIIQILQRAREREDLTDETARKIDDLEKRMENGEPISDEEFRFFGYVVNGAWGGRTVC